MGTAHLPTSVTFTNGNAPFFPISEPERVTERAFTVGNEYYRSGYRASAPGRRYYNVHECTYSYGGGEGEGRGGGGGRGARENKKERAIRTAVATLHGRRMTA